MAGSRLIQGALAAALLAPALVVAEDRHKPWYVEEFCSGKLSMYSTAVRTKAHYVGRHEKPEPVK